MKKITYLFMAFILCLPLLAVQAGQGPEKDRYHESFFQYTRLIMSRQEVEIYRHLPDNEARRQFIREFWDKRDPTPGTDTNENKIAFAQRIQYANKWFHEGKGSADNQQGWNTLRGRIFLQLGPPTDRQIRVLSAQDRYGHLRTTQRAYVEFWYYDQYNLGLRFIANRYNEYEFWGRPPAALGRALREASHQFNYRETDAERQFRYTVRYKQDQLQFKFPANQLSFTEQDDTVTAKFHIELYVYRDFRKKDQAVFKKEISGSKSSILSRKNLELVADYPLEGEGPFYLEVIVTELNSGSITRNTLKTRG